MSKARRKTPTEAPVSDAEDDDGEETFKERFINTLNEVLPVNSRY